MGANKEVEQGGRLDTLLASTAITGALTGATPAGAAGLTTLAGVKTLEIQAAFTYGSGGTTCKAWVQTSLDGGVTWIDIACFAFALVSATKISKISVYAAVAAAVAATDGTLADNTILDGVLGDRFRVKITSVGVYAGGTTLAVTAVLKA